MKNLKSIFCIIFFVININTILTAQVINDDCTTAINLGILDGTKNNDCIDGTIGVDTSIVIDITGASPSIPYYTIIDCPNCINSTISRDIWYKCKADMLNASFFFYVPTLDTLRLNVWHGIDCNNLNPSGCFLFAFPGTAPYYSININGTNIINENVYLQFSGLTLNSTGSVGLCLDGFIGTQNYCGNTNILTSIILGNKSKKISIYPNPISDIITINSQMQMKQIIIYNNLGIEIKRVYLNENVVQVDFSKFPKSIYNISIYNKDGSVINEKIIKN